MSDNIPNSTMVNDFRPLAQPEGTYPFGKNGVQFDFKGAVTNEDGFKRMLAKIPHVPCGIIETDKKPVLLSASGNNSFIGFFNPDTELYENIWNDVGKSFKLKFNPNNWITGQFQRNYKGEVCIAFTDKRTFPKYLNCDNPSITRLEDFQLFPYFKAPTTVSTVISGGRLATGTHYVVTRYMKNDGTITGYSAVSPGRTVSSVTQDKFTDKALDISFTNLDPAYNYLLVAIISKIEGVTAAVELDPVPINGTMCNIIYTGDNLTQEVSLQEVLIPAVVYNKVGCMSQLNDALYLLDLETEPEINDMQPYANLIKLQWKSELLDAINPPLEHISGEKKGFCHEEVMAMYVRYSLTKGGYTRAFHIPGIAPTLLEKANSSEANIGGLLAPKFKVDDIVHTFNPTTGIGDLGPWENKTELYPNDPQFDSTALGGPDLTNGGLGNVPVRHHRFPSTRWCKQNLYAAEPEYGRTKLDILGIIATNIQIPAKYNGIINGYEIMYAKRTISNMTVYGQGLLLHGAVTIADNGMSTGAANIYTSGGNWDTTIFHKTRGDYNDDQDLRLRLDTFRVHAFDMLLNKPGVSADFINSHLRLQRYSLRADSLYEDGQDQDGNDDIDFPIVHLIDYTGGSTTDPTLPVAGQLMRRVKKSFYATNNINVNGFVNLKHETCFAGTLAGPNWPIPVDNDGYRLQKYYDYTKPEDTIDQETTFLITLRGLKDNLYTSFYAQTLVSAGIAKAITDNSPYFGGDVFVGPYTFHTYGRHSGNSYGEAHNFDGKKVIRRFVCESISNISSRYEVPGNEYSKFYPRTSIVGGSPANCYITYFDRSKDPNQFGYSISLNALNDLVSSVIYSPDKELLTKFPYRVQRGGKLSRQNKTRSWRSFLPLDYYECQKNMGFIIHSEGIEDKLLIHHENALFLTQDKAKLESGMLGVTLGSGDIFQFEPQEAQAAKLGYAGTQHDLACVRTPAGYAFIDSNHSELYIFKKELIPINKGLSRFLRQYLKSIGYNPYKGNGATIGWDQTYKRILLTIKNKIPDVPYKMYEDTDDFWNNLVDGDVVNYNGRFIQYYTP